MLSDICSIHFIFDMFYFIKGRISAGHDTLPYGLLVRFSAMTSRFTSISPSRNAPNIDLMTLIYNLKYGNLRIQLYPIRVYNGVLREV